MKLLFLLVPLTRNGAGDINASFVNTETLEQCDLKTLMLSGIFSTAGIDIVESRCIPSQMQFSEFSHASSSNMAHTFYLIHFSDEAVEIQPMPDWRSCMIKQREADNRKRVYCSSTLQSLLTHEEPESTNP
ncbi:MAG: hypothetical protein DIZ77_08960 [endosymbiont of Seepiophila jonesi]|uniref:Uncharacterized protein n=1 Tax=endosymbiont of Lamellibrachia luymesi TaxID=2200907 RepID=A0A370DXA4_9GAMM|nr:MAG: hypothetical protein DIZ79_12400 [endosymbiont of Lamellibrachia luymesi]RDH92226.1 MAG: hypothetical protein DIZ77_08960 [endosymbiont of Seepiophila jonesi]